MRANRQRVGQPAPLLEHPEYKVWCSCLCPVPRLPKLEISGQRELWKGRLGGLGLEEEGGRQRKESWAN